MGIAWIFWGRLGLWNVVSFLVVFFGVLPLVVLWVRVCFFFGFGECVCGFCV